MLPGVAVATTAVKREEPASAARAEAEQSAVIHSSIYLPEPVYDALRKIAFDERLKIHDLVLEGIDAALRRRRYPSIENLKAGKEPIEPVGELGRVFR
jgi:hypothetical protein